MNTLVSCVMPTWNRRAFIPAAIDCFLRQTYENRELVILDDGEEPIEGLIPKDDRIRYVFEDRRRITGDKRNRICELARGEIICHFDDDDFSAADRVQFQVDQMESTGKPVVGFSDLLFWDGNFARRFKSSVKGYVCGTTLCYLKSFWETHKFRPQHEAEDNDFVYPNLKNIAASLDASHMVARIHDCHHASRKSGIQERVPVEMIPVAFWENDKLRLNQ